MKRQFCFIRSSKPTLIHELPRRLRFKIPDLRSGKFHGAHVEAFLESREGVKSARVNHQAASLVVEYDGHPSVRHNILEELNRLPESGKKQQGRGVSLYRKPITTPLRAGMVLAIMPLLPLPWKIIFTWANISKTLLTGVESFIKKGITVEVLDAVAVGVSAWGRALFTANATQFLLDLGEYMKEKTERESNRLLKQLLKPLPDMAWVESNGELTQISSEDIQVQDVVVVSSGDMIPIDGVVVGGIAQVNQASLTGETVAVRKEAGASVLSGSVVEEGQIKIQAQRVGKETAVARISNFIENSLSESSTSQRLADRLADQRVFYTFGTGATVFILTKDYRRLSSVFMVDFSCAPKLGTPIAMRAAMSRAGKRGILFKGAQALENLAEADTFVFDKTGTLTENSLEVVRSLAFDRDLEEEHLLSMAASLEEHSNHPLADAIVREARRRSLPHIPHEEVDFIIAHGLNSRIEGFPVQIGSRHFLEDDERISFADFAPQINALKDEGMMLLLIAKNKSPLGAIGLRDRLRSEGPFVVERLKKLGGKELIMLTGDERQKALQIQLQLGLDKVYYELTPEDKVEIVKSLQREGKRVAFVGDGVNDAAALAVANVGISMPYGSELTRETADISLLRDDLGDLVEARHIATQTMSLINTNFNLAIGMNSGILAGAAVGLLSPVVASLLHNGTTIGILLNALTGVTDMQSRTRKAFREFVHLIEEDVSELKSQ